jgi:hypothetical protein
MIYLGAKNELILQDVSQFTRPSGIVQRESTYITTTDPNNAGRFKYFEDLHPTQVTWSRQNGLTAYKVTEYIVKKGRFIPTVIVSSVAGSYSNGGIRFGFIKKFNKIYTVSNDASSTTIGESIYNSAVYMDPDAIYITDYNGRATSGSVYTSGDYPVAKPSMVLVGENTTQLGNIYELEFIWELKFFATDSSGYSA